MSFSIAKTPTVEAVAFPDEKALARDLQHRLDEALGLAETQPDVLEAMEAQRLAEEQLGRLRKTERVLNQFAKEARERIAAVTETALNAVIETSASTGKPDFRKLGELSTAETQYRYTGRAIERVVEHLIPLAEAASLRSGSHALLAKARGLERMAQARTEKVLDHLKGAVTEEVVLPVDLSKGVVGALLTCAVELRKRAIRLSENADGIENSYNDRREAERENQ